MYHTPGAVFKVVTQVPTASIVAPTVVPVTDPAQAIGRAPVQRSLTVSKQLVHCTVVVRQVACVPQADLYPNVHKRSCKSISKVNGVVPKATIGPDGVPGV